MNTSSTIIKGRCDDEIRVMYTYRMSIFRRIMSQSAKADAGWYPPAVINEFWCKCVPIWNFVDISTSAAALLLVVMLIIKIVRSWGRRDYSRADGRPTVPNGMAYAHIIVTQVTRGRLGCYRYNRTGFRQIGIRAVQIFILSRTISWMSYFPNVLDSLNI